MTPIPSRLLLLAVGLLSAAALSYEILLMRLLAIIQWHHFASMLIGLALLGYGASGAFLTCCGQSMLPHFGSAFTVSAALFSLSSVVCFLIAQNVPLNPLEILWEVREWWHLMLISTLLLLPFFFAATCIGLSFQHYREAIGRIYAADLIGAGIGAVLVIVLLFFFFPGKALLIIGFIGMAAALLGYVATGPHPRWVLSASLACLLVLVIIGQQGAPTVEPSEFKSQAQLLRVMGTRLIKERSSPLGLLAVVASPTVPLRHAPGLSITSQHRVPEQLAVFTDGEGMSVINRYDGAPDSLAFLDDLPTALPYRLLPSNAAVLILGSGGGTDVLQALAHQAATVDAVELNPQLIKLVRDVYGPYSGHFYDDPRVRVHFADARGFVSATADRYSLIDLALIDGFNAAGAGLSAVREDYLYTREGLIDYLSRLAPAGLLAITRWVRLPPRDGIKLFATALAALEAQGIAQAGDRIAWIRNWQVSTLLVKNGDFSRDDINRIRSFCAQHAFDIAYLPGYDAAQTNTHNVLQEPYFSSATSALLGPERAAFIRDYKFDITPSTDDRPYFFHFFRWPLLREAWSLKGAGGLSLLDMGYPVLIATLLQALILSALLILAPLRALIRGGGGTPNRLRTTVYFSCIGLGFMFVEIIFLQKFTFYLAHPLYAIPIVLAGFLIFAGAGSHLAGRVPRRSAKSRAALAAVMLISLMALYVITLTPVLKGTLPYPSALKIALVLVLTAPLALFMGFLFPLGMTRLTYHDASLLPWAYAINGCASVVAAVLASLLSIHYGQTAVLLSAMVLYGVAACSVP